MKGLFVTFTFAFLGSIDFASAIGTIDLQLLIYETDAQYTSILEEQAVKIPGIITTVVGHGTTFEGFGSKYQAIIPVLRKMDANAMVVLSDSRDVLINHPWKNADGVGGSATTQKFIDSFQEFTSHYPGAVVLSAESQCCVGALSYAAPGDYFDEDGRRKGRACNSGHAPCLWNGDEKVIPWENFMKDIAYARKMTGADIYLNAGLMAGKADDMLRVLEKADFEVHEDDQAVLTDYMYRHPHEIILDYKQTIFGNNRHVANGCVFQDETSDKRLIHRETGATPLFIHSPGGYVTCHETLATRLGVDLRGSADERRLLEDWKRNLQNYNPVQPPVRQQEPIAPAPAPAPAPVPVPVPVPLPLPGLVGQSCGPLQVLVNGVCVLRPFMSMRMGMNTPVAPTVPATGPTAAPGVVCGGGQILQNGVCVFRPLMALMAMNMMN